MMELEDVMSSLEGLSAEARVLALREMLADVEQDNARHRFPTPGALAKALDPKTVQTPALSLIDDAVVEAVDEGGWVIITVPPQEGKALSAATPVFTTRGWVQHGDLVPGDEVCHPNGSFVTVTNRGEDCDITLRVEFADGHHLDCHPRHEFQVWDTHLDAFRIVEAGALADTKLHSGTPGRRGYRTRFYLPPRQALRGVGDGTALGALSFIERFEDWWKLIPLKLTAPVQERRALFDAFLVEFSTTSRKAVRVEDRFLAEDFAELARTLGYTATVSHEKRRKPWTVTLTPMSSQHGPAVVSVTEIPPVVGNCIAVSAPDGMYLAGAGLTPTHNSTRVSVWTPVWALMRDPSRRVVVASYAESLARRNAMQARAIVNEFGSGSVDEMTGAALPDHLGIRVAPDHRQASSWAISGHPGGVYATGVQGSLTGRAADVLIIDDPLKNQQQADSEREREKIWEWWTSVAQTRLAPGASVVIIMTRWHQDDLVGQILAEEDKRPVEERRWKTINIPAIAEDGVPDALGREYGEALESARGRTLADFKRIRDSVGPRVWGSLYQGTPAPLAGGLFSTDEINQSRVTASDISLSGMIVSIDPAESGKGDEAGLLVMGWDITGTTYVVEDLSRRMTSQQWARNAVMAAIRHGAAEIVYEAFTAETTYRNVLETAWRDLHRQAAILREHDLDVLVAAEMWHAEGNEGDPLRFMQEAISLIDLIPRQEQAPYRIVPWRKRGDKVARAAGARQAVTTGKLRMIGTHPVLERQMAQWQPGQGSPDRVDAMVNGFDHMRTFLSAPSSIAIPEDW